MLLLMKMMKWEPPTLKPQICVAAKSWRTFCLHSDLQSDLTIKTPPTKQWEEGGGCLSTYQPGEKVEGAEAGNRQSSRYFRPPGWVSGPSQTLIQLYNQIQLFCVRRGWIKADFCICRRCNFPSPISFSSHIPSPSVYPLTLISFFPLPLPRPSTFLFPSLSPFVSPSTTTFVIASPPLLLPFPFHFPLHFPFTSLFFSGITFHFASYMSSPFPFRNLLLCSPRNGKAEGV